MEELYDETMSAGDIGFDPDPRWLVQNEEGQERWISGREAFFASLTASPDIVSAD